VSQAQSEVTGIRACFDVTGLEKHLDDAEIKIRSTNREKHISKDFVVPVRFIWAESITHADSFGATVANLGQR